MFRICSTCFCFSFIYVWHGTTNHVFLWSLFNYFAVMTEMVGTSIGRIPKYANLEKKYLGARNRRRFHALLVSPLFVGSVLSNFYFFMGSDVGHYFVYRAFNSWPFGTPIVMVFAYFGAQFAIEVKNWELNKEINGNHIKYE